MRTVEASNRITRTSSLVEMWLSGLKHLAANEASFGSARSNRAISENLVKAINSISQVLSHLNLTKVSSSNAAWSACRFWKAEVVGSNPTCSRNRSLSSVGQSWRLKPAVRPFESDRGHHSPIAQRSEQTVDNRSMNVQFILGLPIMDGLSTALKRSVKPWPRGASGSIPLPSTILRDVEIGIKADSDSAILGSSPSLSVCGISKDSNATGCKLDTRQCKSVISLI